MKFYHDRSGPGPLPFRKPVASARRRTCRCCGWLTLLGCFGVLTILIGATLQGFKARDVAPVSSNSKEEFMHQSSQRRHLQGWKRQQDQHQKCTQEIHGLMQQQQLDWSQKRKLPVFKAKGNKGGGVIVFWHNAKTGGTTVRKQCASLPGVDYVLLLKPEDYYGGGQLIASRLTPSSSNHEATGDAKHNPNHTLFVELHGMNAPTVLDMESHLLHWRRLSQKHGTPLFVFTLLREPVAYSLSYFNFFHQNVKELPSEEELQRASFNRQCHTLAAMPGHNKRVCALLYKKLYHLFDWVGTTERMTQETLPLLQHLLRFKPAQQRFAPSEQKGSFLLPSDLSRDHYNVAVPGNYSLRMDALSDDTLQAIKGRTCLDRGLWERAQQDYSLSMWDEIVRGRRPE